MSDRFICIHGHFYQPPRENPWISEVETEDSAFPYHDWNERIFHECYGPNAASPLLDSEGRIRRLANNYESISFNFGPTLLSWLERRHPEAYSRIVEADVASARARGGHGNALAQAYNHAILPLASRRDKRTQVRWGLEDFKARFHRDPEGLWLPETAVDEETLEVLIAEGLRFTILSPLQAARVRPLGSGEKSWRDFLEATDTRRPCRWLSREASGRHIDIFFYDRDVSQGIAFEGLLTSGDGFARRMVGSFGGAPPAERPAARGAELLTVATDGESYGHHHRFGNMALSYALEELGRDRSARLTNFGEFLALFPPTLEIEVRPRTAWSCAHGLGRWSDDCGCRIAHDRPWRQAWRAPLRAALDWLADALDAFYLGRSSGLLREPWEARDGYIHRILERGPAADQRFLDRHAARHLTPREAVTALQLCEMQRQRLLMYTSCGWFFDDISGLESTQILKYAARAIELAAGLGLEDAPGLEAGFSERLARCPSNDARHPDGAAVFARLVAPLRVDLPRAAAHFAILEHLHGGDAGIPRHVFDLRRPLVRREAGGTERRPRRLSVTHLRLRHRLTLEGLEAALAVYDRGRADVECRLRTRTDPGGARELADRLATAFHAQEEEDFRRTFEELFPAQPYALDSLLLDDRRRELSVRLPHGGRQRQELVGAWLAEARLLAASPDGDPWPSVRRMTAARQAGIPPDTLPQVQALRDRVAQAFRKLLARRSDGSLREAAALLEAVWNTGLHMNIWELQYLYGSWREKHPAAANAEAARARGTIDRLLKFRPLEDSRTRLEDPSPALSPPTGEGGARAMLPHKEPR